MKPRISMITLGVDDLQKSIEFYEKGLGFPRIKSEIGIAFFRMNGTWLGLYLKKSLAKDANVAIEGSGFSGFTLSHNLSSEEEVDKIFNEAFKAGAKKVKQPQTVFWGGYSGYFKDPNGYLWEVAYNPHFWIGPKD